MWEGRGGGERRGEERRRVEGRGREARGKGGGKRTGLMKALRLRKTE